MDGDGGGGRGRPQTLKGVLTEFEADGYTGQFGARPGGMIRCFACRAESTPSATAPTRLRRLEGASDPDDMLAIVAVRCPRCAAAGTLVLAYGPEAPLEDSEVLAALPDVDPPDPHLGSRPRVEPN
jgi:hypothetical protein